MQALPFGPPYRFRHFTHFISMRPLPVSILPIQSPYRISHVGHIRGTTGFAILPFLPFSAPMAHLPFYHFNHISAATGFTMLLFYRFSAHGAFTIFNILEGAPPPDLPF